MSDVLHQALTGLEHTLAAHGIHDAVTQSVRDVATEATTDPSSEQPGNRNQLHELRQRLKRDVILEVRSLFVQYPELGPTCERLAAMPLTKAVFDTKCDLLYRLAELHPEIRSIFHHYGDLRDAVKRGFYSVSPAETDWNGFQQS